MGFFFCTICKLRRSQLSSNCHFYRMMWLMVLFVCFLMCICIHFIVLCVFPYCCRRAFTTSIRVGDCGIIVIIKSCHVREKLLWCPILIFGYSSGIQGNKYCVHVPLGVLCQSQLAPSFEPGTQLSTQLNIFIRQQKQKYRLYIREQHVAYNRTVYQSSLLYSLSGPRIKAKCRCHKGPIHCSKPLYTFKTLSKSGIIQFIFCLSLRRRTTSAIYTNGGYVSCI